MALPSDQTLRRDRPFQELLALNARLAFEAAHRCVGVDGPDPLGARMRERGTEIIDVGTRYLQRAYQLSGEEAEKCFQEMALLAIRAHNTPAFEQRVTFDMALNLPLPCRPPH